MAAPMSAKEIERNIKSLLSIDGATGSSLPDVVSKATSATSEHSTLPQHQERIQRRVYITSENVGTNKNAQKKGKGSRKLRNTTFVNSRATVESTGLTSSVNVRSPVPPNDTGNDTARRSRDPRETGLHAVGVPTIRATHGGGVPDSTNRDAVKPEGHCPPATADRRVVVAASGATAKADRTLTGDRLKDMLSSNMILELKEQSKAFPKAKFVCHLCNYYMHDVQDLVRHKELRSHKRKVKMAGDSGLPEHLPAPTSAHLAALDAVLQEAYDSSVLPSQELAVREQIVTSLKDALADKIPGFSVRLYGSCASGSALKISDVNVALDLPESANRADALDIIIKTLLDKSDQYKSVTKNITTRSPFVSFFAQIVKGEPDVSFSVAFTDTAKVCSCARFLKECFALDDRVRKLAILLKSLCKMCRLDSVKDHMVPSVTFDIMVVYFAQQAHPPLLPIFHECIKDAKESDLIPESEIVKAAETARQKWKVQNQQSLSELWLRMLKFYAHDFDKKEVAVSVSSAGLIPKTELKWNGKKLAVQDPACYRHNIVHSVKNAAAIDYVEDCIVEAYRYFGVPQTKTGPAFRYVRPHVSSSAAGAPATKERECGDDAHSVPSKPKLNEIDGGADLSRNEAESEADVSDGELCVKLQSMSANSGSDTFADRHLVPSAVHPDLEEKYCYDPKKVEMLTPSDMAFGFECSRFTKGKSLPKYCVICHQGGHSTDDCAEGQVPDVRPLPAFTTGLRKMLDKFLRIILDFSAPSSQARISREDLLRMVERCVQKEYPKARLTLFGSSNNGFGAADSDLDICLTFEGQDTIGDTDTAQIIARLAKCLYKERNFKAIIPIPTAKVPIVKFHSKMHRLEGDLSLYNILAQRNTVLLRCYSEIDQRVRLLGYGLKAFAKTCDIGDASRGSLSSYSYVLMVIYFLQQCQPPVLPVLQELYDDLCPKKKRIVDGRDTYFFDQLQRLSAVWPHVNENKKTAGELWLEMFRFYTEQFDVQNTVVSIRQHKKLTRLEKLWNGPTIAIEDPFDLDHNLGAALSIKMHAYIMTVFINGRTLYGTPPTEDVADDVLWDYFMQQKALIGNLVLPNDRGCRICQKIGHLARDCPVMLQRKERERNAKPKKQQNLLAGGQKAQEGVGRPLSNIAGVVAPLITASPAWDALSPTLAASTGAKVSPSAPTMATAAGEPSRSVLPVSTDASGLPGMQQQPASLQTLANRPPPIGSTEQQLRMQQVMHQQLLLQQLQQLQQQQLQLQAQQLQPQQQQQLQQLFHQRQLQLLYHLHQLQLQNDRQQLLQQQQPALSPQQSPQPLLYLPTVAPAGRTMQTADPMLQHDSSLEMHAAAIQGQGPLLASQSSQVQPEIAVANRESNVGLVPLPQQLTPWPLHVQQALLLQQSQQCQSPLSLVQLQQQLPQPVSASVDSRLRPSSSEDLANLDPTRTSGSHVTRVAVDGARALSSIVAAQTVAAHSSVPVLNPAPAVAAAVATAPTMAAVAEHSPRLAPVQSPLPKSAVQPDARQPTLGQPQHQASHGKRRPRQPAGDKK